MAPQIFISGISGYIGGQTLATLVAKHPEYSIVGLVRKEVDKETILAKYTSIKIILGDLDSAEILIEQSKQADVVIHTADSDHLAAINSITYGLSLSPKPGAYVHLGGAASIIEHPTGYGNLSPKVWDDIADLAAISSFSPPVFHVAADQLLLSEGKRLNVRIVNVEPPMVHGRGEGQVNRQSIGLPMLRDVVGKRGKMFRIGEAKHAVSAVHVKDLADVLIFFTEQALQPSSEKLVHWGEQGIYYVEAEEVVFEDIVEAIAKEMVGRGLIDTLDLDVVDEAGATEIHSWAPFLWGSNMRCRATRLRALGWVPQQGGVVKTVGELFD